MTDDRETTEDYREAAIEQRGGDGSYARDRRTTELTDEIAQTVTRIGGRIPVGFGADVHVDGGDRVRRWTVYAPSPNPYHVAAAVTDLLVDAADVEAVDVRVADMPASDVADWFRSTNVDGVLDDSDAVETVIEHLRHGSNEDAAAVQQVADADVDERTQERFATLANHPADAWDYHAIHISVREVAEEAVR